MSAVATLQAMGTFHTAPIRSRVHRQPSLGVGMQRGGCVVCGGHGRNDRRDHYRPGTGNGSTRSVPSREVSRGWRAGRMVSRRRVRWRRCRGPLRVRGAKLTIVSTVTALRWKVVPGMAGS